ncbi:MAG: tryptophan--tRNA ligase [Oscillospiraceae bacterium]|nr:tryptophan--tRNA ligase [Oscillospiraceae bacterium]
MTNTENTRKTILSGIQPTNTPHLGNYLGATKNWVDMQASYDCVCFVADLHAITVRQDPAKLRAQTRQTYALLMAMGMDADKSILFVQSHNHHHAELNWVLSCFTQFGELSRMTQFKDKSSKGEDSMNAGLFTYPTLQAADILLYQADLVPVGADQKQHLELSRNIAVRFNNAYSPTLVVPEPHIPKAVGKIMSLSEPTKKMSKSDDNPNASVSVLDERDVIIRKFKRAVTDSEAQICYREEDEAKAGINNLLSIYAAVTGKAVAEAEAEFAGRGYGEFKEAVGAAVADVFEPVQREYARLIEDKAHLDACMKSGAQRAMRISGKTLAKVYRKVGLLSIDN